MKEFMESLKDVLRNIETLVFVLDGGDWILQEKVSDVLARYYPEVDNLKNAFDRLNESVGNETIENNPDPMCDFLSTCICK